MTTTVLRPNGTILNDGTVTGAASAHAATSDDSDASYVQVAEGDRLRLDLTSYTLPAGAISKSAKLRTRSRAVTAATGVGSAELKVGPGGAVLVSYLAGRDDTTFKTSSQTAATPGLTQSNIDDLRFVFTHDAGESLRFSEVYVDLVTVAKPVAVVTAVSPDPYTASTAIPIAWTNTLDADGGAQTRYQVQVTDDNDSNAVVFDSGVLVGSNTTINAGPLVNGDYTAQVRVAQTVNGAQHWSDYDTDAFTLTVSTSDISAVVATADNANGAIDVVVTRDGTSEAWEFIEVERSFDAGVTWSPVRTASFVDSTGNASTFSVTDYEAPNGQATVYRARATYYSVGLPISGPWTEATSTSWTSGDEWLKDPLTPSRNIKIESVQFATQQRSNRAGVFYPLGASDAVVVSDLRTSPSGSIMVRVRGQAEALALDTILAGEGVLLLNMLPDSLIGPGRDGFMYIGSVQDDEDWQRQFYADGELEERLVTLRFAQTVRPPDATAGLA